MVEEQEVSRGELIKLQAAEIWKPFKNLIAGSEKVFFFLMQQLLLVEMRD